MGHDEHAPQPFYEIAVASFAAILLEVAYTRIFSFKIFYFFSYVVIAIGLLGLGAGGILVAVVERLRHADPRRLIPKLCFGGGASVLAGYLVVAPMPLDVSRVSVEATETLRLGLVCLLVVVPFTVVGVVIASILGARPASASRLYAADLAAAALGCAVAVPLLSLTDPPRVVVLAGFALAAGGLRLAWQSPRLRFGGAALAAVLLFVGVTGTGLQDPITDRYKGYEDFREKGLVRWSKWNPVFRIDVVELPFLAGNALMVFHDGLPGSGLRRFGGKPAELEGMRKDPRALAFQVLPPRPRVLIIGSAGGHEVLSSILFSASHVTGVELNPATLSLLTDRFADFTGHLAQRADVTFVNADARSFIEQDRTEYDMIWFVAPDSYAAMNAATAGAFVLSESYLYTVEMLSACLRHLGPQGIINAQFGEMDYGRKPNRTTRFLATARAAFEENGVTAFSDHVLLATGPGFPPQTDSVILLSKAPLSPAQIWSFAAYTARVEGGVVRWVPGRVPDHSAPNHMITVPGPMLRARFDAYPWQVDAVRDDSPFFWHFASFRHALDADVRLDGKLVDTEDSVGEKVTLALLAIVSLIAALLLAVPLFTIRRVWVELPSKVRTGAYFAALGTGFMFLEVSSIQRFTLLLGYPTHSLTVTLGGLLVSAGAGSLVSTRYAQCSRKALLGLLGALLVLGVFYLWILPAVVHAAITLPFAVRVAVTLALLAPLGFCLGGFLPVGLAIVAGISPHPREYVAWAWAVNAFFSVVASIVATIVAMTLGFDAVMIAALLIYTGGVLAMYGVPPLIAATSRHG